MRISDTTGRLLNEDLSVPPVGASLRLGNGEQGWRTGGTGGSRDTNSGW
ncbi:hypothetical protein SAMN05661080_01473 [Modestobacter sp. DSM 44400]|nr:hypothetical protein SAMN05661080_01473 [Modestobacter sp. DSM 44400]